MNKLKTFFILLISFLIQTTIFSKIDIMGANVNLIIPAVIAISQILGPKIGGYSGLITGLVEDFLFTGLIGVRALSYFLIGTFVSTDRFKFSRDRTTGVIMTFLSTIFHFLLVSAIYYLLNNSMNFSTFSPASLFIESTLDALIYIIYFAIVKRVMYIPTYRI